jgi:FeS assembly SUF system regulator
MFRIGKLTDYGLIIMSCMATRPAQWWRTEDVAEATRLALPTVRKVLRDLVAAGLLRSERGAHGGYVLARLPDLISVAEIIMAIEGPVAITECCDTEPECERVGDCDMESRWPAINGIIQQVLRAVTLADIDYTRSSSLDVATLLQRLQHRSCPYPA